MTTPDEYTQAAEEEFREDVLKARPSPGIPIDDTETIWHLDLFLASGHTVSIQGRKEVLAIFKDQVRNGSTLRTGATGATTGKLHIHPHMVQGSYFYDTRMFALSGEIETRVAYVNDGTTS